MRGSNDWWRGPVHIKPSVEESSRRFGGFRGIGCSREIRAAVFAGTGSQFYVVKCLYPLSLRRWKRGQIGGAKFIHLGLNLHLIQLVRDLIPQLVYSGDDFPNWRIDLCRLQLLAKCRFFGERSAQSVGGGIREPPRLDQIVRQGGEVATSRCPPTATPPSWADLTTTR
jgi:hypothetical protein